MAGDWIKMRVGIVTHPKVLQIAEALSLDRRYQEWSGLSGFVHTYGGSEQGTEDEVNQAARTTRYVTVTALLKFWGYANEHAKGDFVSALRISDIDEITQIPGFGAALQSVGWAIYDKEAKGTLLPNFSEHNATASDRTNAARQKRYREKQKQVTPDNATLSNATRNVTVTHREEKRREELTPKSKAEPATRATRLQIEQLPNDWRAFCQLERSDLDPERTFAKFCDYWKAKPGKQGVKLDWLATWRNWVREERKANGANGNGNSKFNVHAYTRSELAKSLAPESLGTGAAQEIQPALPGEVCEFLPRSGNG